MSYDMHAKRLYLTICFNGYQYINASVDIFRKDGLTGATYLSIRCVRIRIILYMHIPSLA